MAYFRSETQRPEFVKLEEEILELWDSEDTFDRSVTQRKDCKKFVFIEGPPTANGLPHPGHILTRVVKDLVLRYRTMQGYYVERKAGWDTHGLPVEIEVEKNLRINTKGEIENYGIEKFNKKCKDSVFRYEKEWVNATKRVGFWIDMDSPYITFDNKYIESVWWSLKEIWKKGLLYKGHKVVPYCPRCETTLSSHEVAQGYRDVEDPSVYVKFKLKQPDTYLLAWTTTPWTLLGNIALAVHPENRYVKARVKGRAKEEDLILAESRLDVLKSEYEIIEGYTGADLADLEYERLFDFAAIEGGDSQKVITADFVTLEEGTGVVHIAPAFGEDDYRVCRDKKLGFSQPVNAEGRFTSEVPLLEGMFVKDADRPIIEMLDQRGILYKEERYSHSYPFCWRCGSPLLYYARESWFIAMKSLRDKLMANNEKINWYPAHLKHGRFGNFLDNIEDWALSRERFWGTPLNIWICANCGKEFCVGSVKELKERAKNSVSSDLHRPYIDDVVFECEDCSGEMRRVEDVIDCWYDSGAAPFAQWHYPFEKDEFERNFPADFITEAIDQTRGWFYSLLAISTTIFDTAPYLNVLSLGHILDEKGVKMSKSKGNVVDITSTLDKEGADALRWYFYTAGPLSDDVRFTEKGIIEKQKKFLNTLWNSYFFFVTYAVIDEFNPNEKKIPVERRNAMDRWIISRLNTLTKEVIESIERFEIHVAARKIEEFIVNDLSNWYIRRSRRRFWIVEADFDKDSAYITLFEVLVSLCKLLAPFVPFITEHIYQKIVRGVSDDVLESVHLCDYPSPEESLIDTELEDSMGMASKLVEAGRRARAEAGIKIRQPLKEVVVVCSDQKRKNVESLVGVLKDELNVNEVRFEDDAFVAADVYKQVDVDEDTTLFLDTYLDKGLIEEGLVRDLVRRIQGMRKDIDLEYTAKIRIMYEGDEEVKEAIDRFSDYICTETLAENIEKGKPSESGDNIYEKDWKIGKKEVHLAINSVN
ncbi:isoleucine--tRNA ligase [ANME-1 cluster archaeon AG-394-G06]|nr:isoleucine--tRNA ligase [ANME-1 cluster archaeon AG-394-G06]